MKKKKRINRRRIGVTTIPGYLIRKLEESKGEEEEERPK